MLKSSKLIAFWIGCTVSVFAQVPRNPCPSSGLQPVIVYSVRGGQTGTTTSWSLLQDGTVCSANHVVGRLSSDSVRRLLDEITAAGFFNLKESYKDAKAAKLCHQCNYYKTTVQSGNRSKTVQTNDGAKNVPRSLWEINSRIQQQLKLAK